MREFSFYSGATESAVYCYHVREAGQVIGSKVLRNIPRRRKAWLTALRNWAICSLAVLAFFRLMMIPS